MPEVRQFIEYKGLRYDVGTRLKVNWYGVEEGKIEKFIGATAYIRFTRNNSLIGFSTIPNMIDFDKIIVEIIEPVYYVPKESCKTDNRNYPAPWDVEIGWIWYIIIMVVGAIFKDRFMIWIFASVFFFLWKTGRLNKKK